MAQVTDYVIANGSGSAVRADINNVLAAANSSNSGTSAPSSAVPGSLWFDTSVSPAALKRRNAANTAWIEVSPDTVPPNTLRGNSTGSASAETNVSVANILSMLDFGGTTSGSSRYFKVPVSASVTYIVQFANIIATTNSTGGFSFTFPFTFPSACLAFIPVNGDTDATGGLVSFNIGPSGIGTTGGVIATGVNNTPLRMHYIAIGV